MAERSAGVGSPSHCPAGQSPAARSPLKWNAGRTLGAPASSRDTPGSGPFATKWTCVGRSMCGPPEGRSGGFPQGPTEESRCCEARLLRHLPLRPRRPRRSTEIEINRSAAIPAAAASSSRWRPQGWGRCCRRWRDRTPRSRRNAGLSIAGPGAIPPGRGGCPC